MPPTEFQSIAPFVQANMRLFDGKMHLVGGVRQENVELSVNDFTTLGGGGGRPVGRGR